MQYGYRCETCGPFDSVIRDDREDCPGCGRPARRVWRFKVDTSFEPYYAPSFGTIVRSRTHAKDLAKIASEEQTIRTGIESHYEVVDTHDDEAVGIDKAEKEHYAEETRRHAVNGAAWSTERLNEIQAERDRLRAEKDQAKVDA